MKPIKDYSIRKGVKANELAKQLRDSGGFGAKDLGIAVDILEVMIQKDCTRFLSFPANIISTGTRGIIRDMVKEKMFSAIITTCGTLDHDLARVWKDYYHGSFHADDAKLYEKHIHRLGNVFVPMESYGKILEEKLRPMFSDIYKKKKHMATNELIKEIGIRLSGKKAKESIIYWAAKNKIPVFVPGITDGAFGSQLWLFWQDHKDFIIDVLRDEQDLSNIVYDSKKRGALIIGGGISKHHVIWHNQFKHGLDYAVYITTASEYDGSLSGARTHEAISWGKINKKANHVTLLGDATICLPIIYAALKERL